MKKFNVKATLEAYEISKHKFDYLSQQVHQEMLCGSYFTVHCNVLRKAVTSVARFNGEVLKVTIEGMLESMIPNPIKQNSKAAYTDAELQKCIVIAAQLIVSVLVDSGEFNQRVDKISGSAIDGKQLKFTTKTVLLFTNIPKDKSKLYGVETSPGVFYQKRSGSVALPPKFKKYLKDVGSFAFKLSDVANYDLLVKCLSFSKAYNYKADKNDPKKRESRLVRRERLCKDIAIGLEQFSKLEQYYLPMNFDTRSRMYYLFQLNGFRPQGKAWEVLMTDAAVGKVLDLRAIDHLKHIIYVARYGRNTLLDALSNWTDADMAWAKNADPMSIEVNLPYNDENKHLYAAAEKLIGDYITVNKAAKCIEQTIAREPTHYLFGKDLTNSGLMIAGSSFKSPRMIYSSNLLSLAVVKDSYSDARDEFGLDGLIRKDMKSIITPMLHGASINSLLKNVQLAVAKLDGNTHRANTLNIEFMLTALNKTFGPEMHNIQTITAWGKAAVNNYRTQLLWTTPDGFKAQHIAHIGHCPVRTKVATATTAVGFREVVVVRDMPASYTAKGLPYVTRDFKAPADSKDPVYKDNGYYANITHSVDATLAREVANSVIDKGEVCLLKHDDYIMFADGFDDAIVIVQNFFKKCNDVNFYQKALEDSYIAGSDMPLLPELVIGEGKVEESVNMLMP